jgi:hypothetical protein
MSSYRNLRLNFPEGLKSQTLRNKTYLFKKNFEVPFRGNTKLMFTSASTVYCNLRHGF